MGRKYELSKESKDHDHVAVYRIKALQSFITETGIEVNSGDLGGFIECENNLSQEGLSWIHNDSVVYKLGRVDGNCEVFDNSVVSERALLVNNVILRGNTEVRGVSQIENTVVDGEVIIMGISNLKGEYIGNGDNVIKISGKSRVYDSDIQGKVYIKDSMVINDSIIAEEEINIIESDVERSTLENKVVILKSRVSNSHLKGDVSLEESKATLCRIYSTNEKDILSFKNDSKLLLSKIVGEGVTDQSVIVNSTLSSRFNIEESQIFRSVLKGEEIRIKRAPKILDSILEDNIIIEDDSITGKILKK
ncbi:hypothetical protein [Clostridium cylindrosporum]|uniref:Uncharacterized protein n=1 Tax=Clostridium cylindrosporum DSM 605 TaxID=1121307 RepID=A0A0J8G160_CLOCY|nr:hypothetical protein [Clostridium cylindrosporum]KMT21496.1 hypothetical protein CLCY_2c02560 [Clostridium cylindrosporum DSM 605]